jgi:hypothetical protein
MWPQVQSSTLKENLKGNDIQKIQDAHAWTQEGPFTLKGAMGAKVGILTKDYILHVFYMD